MDRYCLTLDLKDNLELIGEYERFHENVWPEIKESIRASGITEMQIYRFSNRLCMIMEVTDNFSFEKKAAEDADNPKVQEWENLLWKFQQAVPGSKPGEKWVLMKKIFELSMSIESTFRVKHQFLQIHENDNVLVALRICPKVKKHFLKCLTLLILSAVHS